MKGDFYAVLNLDRRASPAEIKKRFLTLARTRHPDRFRGAAKIAAETEFQAITEAFNVLSDPDRRREYDQERDVPQARPSDPKQLAKLYISRGARDYKAEKFIDAANHFRLATEAEPGNADAWLHLARTCLTETRWLGKGREAIERALDLKPRDLKVLKVAGQIFAAAGMASRARQYYNQALKLGGTDPSITKALERLEAPRSPERGR